MPRWEQNAAQRLKLAALDLYAAQGYDRTTISDIAAHAGVTSRTYFRYFPDKREVLFDGSDDLRDQIQRSLRDAPADLSALTACLYAISTCEDLYRLRGHEHLRHREAIINSSEELQEREARKLASIAAVMAAALVERGSDDDSAQLVADLGVAVFKQAARLWSRDPDTPYAVLVHRAAAQAEHVVLEQAARATPST